jgi:hypothetical protein
MDAQLIDEEYQKLQAEFEDVAKTVQALAEKLQAAEQAGDKNATEWLVDLKQIAQDVDDEQTQAKVLLLAIHGFIRGVAQGQAATVEEQPEHPPLLAPGHELPQQPPPQPAGYSASGPMMGGGMFGGYMGGGFARAMERGAGMSLGASLVNSIFR